MGRPGVDHITTMSTLYLDARRKLLVGEEITVEIASVLVGVTEKTMRQYAERGRFGARKVKNCWIFDRDKIKAEMGMNDG